jgi:hypothetical protein
MDRPIIDEDTLARWVHNAEVAFAAGTSFHVGGADLLSLIAEVRQARAQSDGETIASTAERLTGAELASVDGLTRSAWAVRCPNELSRRMWAEITERRAEDQRIYALGHDDEPICLQLDELLALWTDAFNVRAKRGPAETKAVPIALMAKMLAELRQRRAEDELYGQQMADRNRDVEMAGAELRRATAELEAGKAELARARETLNTALRLKLDVQAERDALVKAAREVVAYGEKYAPHLEVQAARLFSALATALPPQEPEIKTMDAADGRGGSITMTVAYRVGEDAVTVTAAGPDTFAALKALDAALDASKKARP